MGSILPPAPALVISRSAIVNKDGTASWEFVKILQNWALQINNSLNAIGQFIGIISSSARISGRNPSIGTLFSQITDTGQMGTDSLIDQTGSPLAGGKTAYQALVASGPVNGKALVFTSGSWTPENVAYNQLTGTPTLPVNTSPVGSRWLNSYNATSGAFGQTQPAFGDISGTLGLGQAPGITHTAPLAKLTSLGANGSLTFTNGVLTGAVDPT